MTFNFEENTIDCLCGSRDFIFVREVPYKNESFSSKIGKARIIRCSSCNLKRTSPSPHLLFNNFYEEGNVSESHEKNIELWEAFSNEIIDKVYEFKQSGKLLDVGCNIGILVDTAGKSGFEAKGIDLNKSAIEYGKEKFNIDLEARNLDSLDENEKYDVIVMNHVIEHIDDIKEFSKNILRVLKKDGLFLVACPNAESGITKFLSLLNKRKSGAGSNWIWYGYLPEEHIWQFGPKNLKKILIESGFNVKKINAKQNMHWGATELKGIRYKFLKYLFKFYKNTNRGDNLFAWCFHK